MEWENGKKQESTKEKEIQEFYKNSWDGIRGDASKLHLNETDLKVEIGNHNWYQNWRKAQDAERKIYKST